MNSREERRIEWIEEFEYAYQDHLAELDKDFCVNVQTLEELKEKAEELVAFLENAQNEYAKVTMTKEDYMCIKGAIQ